MFPSVFLLFSICWEGDFKYQLGHSLARRRTCFSTVIATYRVPSRGAVGYTHIPALPVGEYGKVSHLSHRVVYCRGPLCVRRRIHQCQVFSGDGCACES